MEPENLDSQTAQRRINALKIISIAALTTTFVVTMILIYEIVGTAMGGRSILSPSTCLMFVSFAGALASFAYCELSIKKLLGNMPEPYSDSH